VLAENMSASVFKTASIAFYLERGCAQIGTTTVPLQDPYRNSNISTTSSFVSRICLGSWYCHASALPVGLSSDISLYSRGWRKLHGLPLKVSSGNHVML